MIRIITDTSTLFTPQKGKELGIDVIPLCVTIENQSMRDLMISTEDFLEKIKNGAIPTSSQPPIGEVVEAYNKYPNDIILNICMADGLSGTYQTAIAAKQQVSHAANIHVLNSKTLCGCQRYLVEKAIFLSNLGKEIHEIIDDLHTSIQNSYSYLIPQDFSFLKRGGRLKGTAAALGGLLKLKPIMEAVDGGTRLDKFAVSRTLSKACDTIIHTFKEKGIDSNYRLYISHADASEARDLFVEKISKAFPLCKIEVLNLSPAFITQGGPECIAVQAIKE